MTQLVDCIYHQWLDERGTAIANDQLINMHSLSHPKYFEDNRDERIRFFEAIASTELVHLLTTMFGDNLYFHNAQLFFNPHKTTKQPYWHRDLQYSPIDDSIQKEEHSTILTIHLRIPLLPEKGIELIPHSHQHWDSELERDVRFELNNHKNHEPLPGAVLIELEPGDVLIFNAQIIHRGNYALNAARKALDLCIAQPHPLLSGFLDTRNLPSNEEIDQIQNNTWYVNAWKLASNHASFHRH